MKPYSIPKESGSVKISEKPIRATSPTSNSCAEVFPVSLFDCWKPWGISDPRGTLFFEIARLTAAKRPAYLLLENVPGLLNHDRGRTFAAILHTLDRLGYGWNGRCSTAKILESPNPEKGVSYRIS